MVPSAMVGLCWALPDEAALPGLCCPRWEDVEWVEVAVRLGRKRWAWALGAV